LTDLFCSKSDAFASDLSATVDILSSDVLKIVSELKQCLHVAMMCRYPLSLFNGYINTAPNYLSTTFNVFRRYML
jgi:hypothetical protein